MICPSATPGNALPLVDHFDATEESQLTTATVAKYFKLASDGSSRTDGRRHRHRRTCESAMETSEETWQPRAAGIGVRRRQNQASPVKQRPWRAAGVSFMRIPTRPPSWVESGAGASAVPPPEVLISCPSWKPRWQCDRWSLVWWPMSMLANSSPE